MPFSLLPSVYAESAIPSLDDWKGLWASWDAVTRGMLPGAELHAKPIHLRNACIFYLGHIPAFLDIQLTKTTGEPLTEPAWYRSIFERGIDPDVDNPERCHDHSEIPEEWPPVEDIQIYQGRVRSRLQQLYNAQGAQVPRSVGRAIWVGFEHELMHIETLLYMMLQSDKTLPPPAAPRPNFEELAREAASNRVENSWFAIPQQRISIGLHDSDEESDLASHFGWDNERPRREVDVRPFQAKGRPLTNEEYARFLYTQSIGKLPASWTQDTRAEGHSDEGVKNGYSNGNAHNTVPPHFLRGKYVRTVYGPVPLEYALDWPIHASYDELSACAAWMGGRIPTFEEARCIYHYVNTMKKKDEAERTLGKTVPAVNSHLINNGVEETPPATPPSEINEEAQQDLFIDLDGANVGFQHWHPVPVTAQGGRLAGQAELGGVWEWTSSVLEKYDGFEPLSLYPGYTLDFFDGKHNIVLGGSWATHPRIAGRKTFVNWYQRNYPYAWAGARLVRSL